MLIFTILGLLLSSMVQFEDVLTSSTKHLCHFHESISLLQFKKEMHSFSYPISSPLCDEFSQYSYPKMISWNKSSSDCCQWDGVKCHEITGHVIGLELSCSRLKGFLQPNSSLFHLSYLEKLNLAYNDFSFSKLSPSIGRLTGLTSFNFSYSYFEGIIPSEIFNLPKLVLLDLSGNQNLQFSPGHFHILLLNLSHAIVLCLHHLNILTNLPENMSSSLASVDLGFTELRGKLPMSIFHLPRLQKLIVNGNGNLTINLPKRNTSSLQVLDLSDTNLNADRFTDSIPSFPLLKSLALSGCQLNGSFPTSFSNLSQMVHLDLSLNKFTVDFSSVITYLPRKLANLDVNWNYLKGLFPCHIGNLTQLHLRSNFLNGNFPATVSVLSKLQTLDLSGNAFDGQIPFWLFSSPSLVNLDLSKNFLTGQITEFTAKSLKKINLSSNNFKGSIDITVFKHLSELEELKLSNNKLSLKIDNKRNLSFPDLLLIGLSSCQITEFPSFLINSKNLIFLDLSNNKLIGQVPHMLTMYPLRSLNLSHNSLSDLGFFNTLRKTLPLIKSLEILDLSSNKFKELLPLSLCSFKNLYILDFSYNNFMGTIPKCYGEFGRFFEVLNLERNELEGIISMYFPENNEFVYLNLNGNSLQGRLPRSLGNCKNLIVLDLGNNKIKDGFPNLENLTQLQVLILKSNNFFGNLSNVENEYVFTELQVFDLSCNEFNGALPFELLTSFRAMTTKSKMEAQASGWNHENEFFQYPVGIIMKGEIFNYSKILTVLVAIDLSSNRFVGKIPECIGNLNSLVVLNLSHNKFSGPIPSTLGNLYFLESLDLSFNKLEGMIPWQLADATFLEILNLSQNRLVGPIPQGKQFNTFLNDSYSGNLGLCGLPLTIKCTKSNPSLHPSQGLSYIDDNDSCLWCEFAWKSFLIGDIIGTLFGCFLFFQSETKMADKE